jgi:hypothetical protein
MNNVETDLDLPPVRRSEANYWKAKYFEALRDLAAAGRGIRRLRQKLNYHQKRAESHDCKRIQDHK